MSETEAEREVLSLKIRLAELEAAKAGASAPTPSKRGGYVLPIAIIIVCAFIVFVYTASRDPTAAEPNPVDKIDASCRRNYGPDPGAIARCKIVLDENLMHQMDVDKAKRAMRDAGQ